MEFTIKIRIEDGGRVTAVVIPDTSSQQPRLRPPTPPRVPNGKELTAREIQVLELIKRGMNNKEIGTALDVKPGTVKIHTKHIFEKLGVRRRWELSEPRPPVGH